MVPSFPWHSGGPEVNEQASGFPYLWTECPVVRKDPQSWKLKLPGHLKTGPRAPSGGQ